MGKKCHAPTPSLNSSLSNSILTNASSHQQHHQHNHNYSQSHSNSSSHHLHSQSTIPLPPPLPPPLQQQQQQQHHLPQKYMNSKRKYANNNYHNMLMHPAGGHLLDHNNYLHLNSLWSIWYGVLLTLFQGYLAVHGAYRFLGCSLISWKYEPVAELNLQIVLSGVVFILLPFFFASAVFKVGNLANDGIKLANGGKERRCSITPHDGLEEEARGGTLRALWTHGGPTAAFVHIVIAMCLLLPRLLLEARIIENGLLPRENIWQTELDFIAVNRRNLVVLSVMTAPYQNATLNNDNYFDGNNNSLEDDQGDEYYNDTMFMAVGSAGTTATKINNNNNLLDTFVSSTRPGQAFAKKVGGREGDGKAKNNKNVAVDFIDNGKTRYFHVPDLNKGGRNEKDDGDDDGDDDDDDDDDNGAENEFKQEAEEEEEDMFNVGGAERGGGERAKEGVDGFGGRTGDDDDEERIFVEHFDAKEFDETKFINIPTTKLTTQSTMATSATTTTTAAATTQQFGKKNYDKMWDKLGTLGKANNALDTWATDMATAEAALTTTQTTKVATSDSTSTTSTSASTRSEQAKTTTTTKTTATSATKQQYDDDDDEKTTATKTTTASSTATTTTTKGTKATTDVDSPNYASKGVQSTTTTTTTTTTNTLNANDKSGEYSKSNNNKNINVGQDADIDSASAETSTATTTSTTAHTPATHTQPTTRSHHHQLQQHHHHQHNRQPQQQQHQQQQHQHQRNKEQPQQTNTPVKHSAKSTRKHRPHHRQRGGGRRQQQQQHHHHGGGRNGNISKSAATETGSSNGRHSDESTARLDTGHAIADLRPASNGYPSAAAGIDLNLLDELDSASGSIFDIDPYDYDARRGGNANANANTKSTSTISTTTRDSNIHIVKPEKLPPEFIPSTPLTSNSKIIEIKTKSSGAKRTKRTTDLNTATAELNDDNGENKQQVEIEPEYLVGEFSADGNDSSEYFTSSADAAAAATTAKGSSPASGAGVSAASPPPQQTTNLVRLDGFAGMLQIFFGIEKPIDMSVFEHPPSAEFVNLVFALLVWCVRYPAVFWTTTKSFACIFSIQIIAVAFDIIFSYIGASNLYKLQVYSEAQPIQNPGLVLNGVVTLSLYLLSSALMIASSMIMYLYGHGRLAAKMRDRSLITMKSSETWIYFAHCASLCYVLALAVVKAPLLNDLSVTYKNNLHCPTFLSALISVVHLLLWIVIWLGLTAKRRWTFKLPPMDVYGITKATTQPLLMANRSSLPSAGSISGSSEQKSSSIMSNGGGGGGVGVGGGCGAGHGSGGHGGKMSTESSTDGGAEDVYWPKMTPGSPKLKVTFNEVPSTCDDNNGDDDGDDDDDGVLLIGDHEQNDGKRHPTRGTAICFASATGEIDDGEYATLRTASAAVTMAAVAINMANSISYNSSNNKNNNRMANNLDPVMTIGCGNETHISAGGDSTNHKTTSPTTNGIHNSKLSQFDEYDELPPPPPQLISTQMGGKHLSSASPNCNKIGVGVGGGGAGTGAGGGRGLTGTSSFGGEDSNSEEGKLFDCCVRDDSVTYASTRDLEPPAAIATPPLPPPPPSASAIEAHQQSSAANIRNPAVGGVNGRNGVGCVGRAPQAIPESMQLSSSPEHLVSPLAPVTVTVHTNEAHIASSSTPRCLRRADSGVPNEALTPRSETTSTTTTESTISPPERAPSESSSGVHSGEEREVEVIIRPRTANKPPPKPPQPPIQEEPYGRCTNMRMSSFGGDATSTKNSGGGRTSALAQSLNSSATLPLPLRAAPEQKFDYVNHCSTMPLPAACHSQQQQQQQQAAVAAAAAAVAALGSGSYGMTTSAYSMHSTQPPLPPPPLNGVGAVGAGGGVGVGLSSFRSAQYANSSVAMAGAQAARMQQQQQQQQLQQQQQYSQPQSSSPPPPPPPAGMHTTLPNGVRYSNPHFLRRLPHVTKAAESPYGHLGLGAGHHTFSKLLQDPLQLQNSLVHTTIPEDRDSANYSMSSENDCGNLYATAQPSFN